MWSAAPKGYEVAVTGNGPVTWGRGVPPPPEAAAGEATTPSATHATIPAKLRRPDHVIPIPPAHCDPDAPDPRCPFGYVKPCSGNARQSVGKLTPAARSAPPRAPSSTPCTSARERSRCAIQSRHAPSVNHSHPCTAVRARGVVRRAQAVEDAIRRAGADAVDELAHLGHAHGAAEELGVGVGVVLDPPQVRVQGVGQRLRRGQRGVRLDPRAQRPRRRPRAWP